MGLAFDFISETQCLVRTIPNSMPQLDLKQALVALSDKSITNEQTGLSHLVSLQTVNAFELDEADKQGMITFFSDEITVRQLPFARLLDSDHCRSVLHA